jgi:hypothetical protein
MLGCRPIRLGLQSWVLGPIAQMAVEPGERVCRPACLCLQVTHLDGRPERLGLETACMTQENWVLTRTISFGA